jgi:hypothetical protein
MIISELYKRPNMNCHPIDYEEKILIIKGDLQKYVFGAESIYSFSEMPHVVGVIILFYSTIAYCCIQLEDQIVTYFR